MTESNVNVVAETEPGYGQLFAVLMRRRFWLLAVLFGVLSITTVLTLIAEPTYQSSMRLLVEPNYQGKEGAGDPESENKFADSTVEIDYATQLNVMRSSLLLQTAVDLLSSEYPDISTEEIKDSLVLTPVLEELENKVNTKIVEVVYTDNDPIKTQKVLEAAYRVYQAYNREQQEQRLRKGLKFINEQIPAVSKLVARSEAKLEQFRKNQDTIAPEQQATATSEALRANEQEQQATSVQLQEAQARYTTLQQQVTRSPQQALASSRLSESPRYQTLLNELQKIELALAQQRVNLKDNNPTIQRLLELRQSQRDLLQLEAGRVLERDPAQPNGTGGLLAEGHLGESGLDLVEKLAEAQANLRALKARSTSLTKNEQQLRAELNRFSSLLTEYNRLQPLVQINRDKLEQLLKAQQELSLEIARGGFDWQLLEEPQPGLHIGPNTKQNLLLGVVVGLMLGSVAAFLREMNDDAIHTPVELGKQVALPVLGTTPKLLHTRACEPVVKLPFGKPQAFAPWTVQVINWSQSWESLDLIYKNIQLLNPVSTFRSLMITSSLTSEGKSVVALGLALSAARLHHRVLLIDADLRCPSLHQRLKLPNEQGLSTMLVSDVNIPRQSCVQSSGSHIDVLTAGPKHHDPANLLSSHRMRELMTAFEQTYDLVVLDASPVLGMVDAIIAASFCSGVVLVADLDKATRTELMQTTVMLSKLNAIGVIANETGGSKSAYPPKT